MAGDVLTQRALNRSLLARQGLLERSPVAALEMVERLVGLQAQVPGNPYVALWSRIDGFDARELSALVADGRAVRAQVMRSTIHLLSARDCLAIQPLTRDVLARAFRSPFAAGLAGADPAEVAAAGVEHLRGDALTRAELGPRLAPRWPRADPVALAHAVTFHAALVQVPPRGEWRRSGSARWAPTETFLGAPVDAEPDLDALVLRYLAAFGPATAADVRTWSGLAGLRAAIERLRPDLRIWRDERGRELLDAPGAPFPEPGTPAPPRFLPEYDNAGLSHADRSRILAGLGPGPPLPPGGTVGTVLVDGWHRANWGLRADGGAATLTVDRFRPRADDPPGTLDDLRAEAEGLLAFLAPEATDRRVRFVSGP